MWRRSSHDYSTAQFRVSFCIATFENYPVEDVLLQVHWKVDGKHGTTRPEPVMPSNQVFWYQTFDLESVTFKIDEDDCMLQPLFCHMKVMEVRFVCVCVCVL